MKEDDWGTPRDIAVAARGFMHGMDLDPASSKDRNAVVQADRILRIEDADAQLGIPVEWGKAQAIFINPPGGCRPDKFNPKTGKWSGPTYVSLFWAALAAHLEENPYAVFTWVAYNINQMQTLQQVDAELLKKCVVCVPSSRVQYLDKASEPVAGTPSASAILGYCSNNGRTNVHMFKQNFARIGAVWGPV